MFIQKPRRTSNNGIITTPYSYSNTNQTDNTPVTEVTGGGDLNHLSPTLTQPPIAPDTITPQLTPDTDRINLMLPVSGFVGTVYVVLTKPTPSAAVVVVEVTNDGMAYNSTIDKEMLDPVDEPEDEPEDEPNQPAKYDPNFFEMLKNTIRDELILTITYHLGNRVIPQNGRNVEKVVDILLARLIPKIKRASYTVEIDGVVTPLMSEINTGFIESNVNFNHWTKYDWDSELLIPVIDITDDYASYSKTINLGERINPRHEIYYTRGNVSETKHLSINMYIQQDLMEDANVTMITGFLTHFDITVNYVPVIHCAPFVESFDIDMGTFKLDEQYDWEINTPPPEEEEPPPPKHPVRRGYINIGGKLKYLYSVKTETPTEVFINYDGSNYGVTVTTPDRTKVITQASMKPTASFTNNVNGFTLTDTQQTALEQCLPQPEDTLAGGFKAMNGATEISFKTYGFKSIFYQTPTKYNNTTLKACAVYGL